MTFKIYEGYRLIILSLQTTEMTYSIMYRTFNFLLIIEYFAIFLQQIKIYNNIKLRKFHSKKNDNRTRSLRDIIRVHCPLGVGRENTMFL